MTSQLKSRISRFVSGSNVVELDLKRNAKFGRLNVSPSFDLVRHIQASEARGDIRREFGRRVARGVL